MILILFICGVITILISLFYFYIGYGSKLWPYTTGTVVHSCISIKTNKASSSKHKHYHPNIHYKYAIKGKAYESNRIGSFLGFDQDEVYAQNIVNTFPEKLEIKVYYCPYFPSISVLITGMQQIIAQLLFLFLGVIIIFGTYPILFTDTPGLFTNMIFGFYK